jgi:hypothetical protein
VAKKLKDILEVYNILIRKKTNENKILEVKTINICIKNQILNLKNKLMILILSQFNLKNKFYYKKLLSQYNFL